MRTLIIADDLTGALDVAGPFAQRGVDTWVVVDAQQDWPLKTRDATVVSVNADSRHLSARAAADRVTEILSRVDVRDRILIKKIDSTLRGQVVAETLAMLRVSGRHTAIVAPAFPAQNRTVRDGVVYVKGVPLPETTFAKDALSPPPFEPLHIAFARADSAISASCATPAHPFAPSGERGWGEGPDRVLVIDSQQDSDLLTVLDSVGFQLAGVLWVGSAGIAHAIAQRCYPLVVSAKAQPHAANAALIVVGSRAAASREQVRHMAFRADVSVIDAPNGEVDHSRLVADPAPVIVLRATAGAKGEGDAELVARLLGAATAKVLGARPIAAVIATGGDTARAILCATGCGVLRVMGDLMPGIPYSQIAGEGRTTWLITKAGGFGTPNTLSDIVAQLRS